MSAAARFAGPTDWSALACFDGDEPACDQQGDVGLSAVQTSSWLVAAFAVAAVSVGFVLAWRLRRALHLVPVLLLCLAAVVSAHVLWARV